MKKIIRTILIFTIIIIYGYGLFSYYQRRDEYKVLEPTELEILGHKSYVYEPEHKEGEKLPLVVTFHGRGGSALEVVYKCGWDHIAYENKFIVVSPQYDGYAIPYTITDELIEIVKYAIANYDVDETRVYASGFSMGGAASVALARDYPEYFAGIAPFGWMFDAPDKNNVYEDYDMPFLAIQGTNEFTYEDEYGNMAIHKEEQKAIRSLLLYNELIDETDKTDLEQYPFWGFSGDEQESVNANNQNWIIDTFYKEGYSNPFARLVEREDGEHTKDRYSSTLAWNFLSNFARIDGEIIEID